MDSIRFNDLRESLFFYSLLLTVLVFPFSEALVSIASGLLLLQAILLRSWNHPHFRRGNVKDLIAVYILFGVYLTGAIFAQDLPIALYELKKVIFWVIVPTAFFLSPPLPEKKTYMVLCVFVFAVFAGSIHFTVKLLVHDNLLTHEIRNLGIISNIRFSFQVILSLIILAWFIYTRRFLNRRIQTYWMIAIFTWLTIFLFLLQSLLGIFSLFATVAVVLLYYLFRIRKKSLRAVLLLSVSLVVITPVFYILEIARDFYHVEETDPDSVEYFTPSGNIYQHDFENESRENGNLVYIYICHDELRKEWNIRSEVKYDDMLGEYPLHVTLIRYMASLGYRKDSVGISRLTDRDIQRISQGITNYRFKNRFPGIYPRIYETIWELDSYFRTGDPNNKSLAQRIEYLKASLLLIRQNPLTGIGTGNFVRKYNEVYDAMGTKLDANKRASSHNQYLNYVVKFGIIGFLIILTALLIPVFRNHHQRNFMFILFLISMAFANFGDANLESHMGLSFFVFFYSLFLWNSTPQMKSMSAI